MDSENIPASGNGKKRKMGIEALQWILVILGAFIVALLIRSFVFEFVMVDGPSMQNTLHTGERLFVYKLGYNISSPKRGDIIVFQYQKGEKSYIPFLGDIPLIKDLIPKKDEVDYIKRAVAVPGDEVDIKDGFIYINGNKTEEPYAVGDTQKYSQLEYPLKIPPNKIFAVGDNRNMSKDSRQIGLIDYEQIKGKAVFRLFPMSKFGKIG